jgi:FkbM family methyltransferase
MIFFNERESYGIEKIMEFICPDSMMPSVRKVLAGEYSIPLMAAAPFIVDIGANVGSFAVWASKTWVDSTIYCYEPMQNNFEMLVSNTRHLNNVTVHNVGVGNPAHNIMYKGLNNCGEASFFQLGEQADTPTEHVTVISPLDLPEKITILKVDTEGCEIEIIEPLISGGRDFAAILFEYHAESDRRALDNVLKDYILVGSSSDQPHRGVNKYIHMSLF